MLFGILKILKKLSTWDVDASQLTDGFKELYEIYKKREEIFAWLEPYKRAYYEWYLGTTLSLAIVPVKYWKVGKLVKGKGDSKTIGEIREVKKTNSWDKSITYSRINDTDFFKNNSSLVKTPIINKWKAVFKDSRTWNYYSLDSLHYNHLEVFDKRGNHLWSWNPKTWEIIPWTKKDYIINIQ
jgi:hypothetical protein